MLSPQQPSLHEPLLHGPLLHGPLLHEPFPAAHRLLAPALPPSDCEWCCFPNQNSRRHVRCIVLCVLAQTDLLQVWLLLLPSFTCLDVSSSRSSCNALMNEEIAPS